MTPLSHVLAYNSTAFPILTHFMRVFNLQNMFIMPFTDNLSSRIFFNKKALALIPQTISRHARILFCRVYECRASELN